MNMYNVPPHTRPQNKAEEIGNRRCWAHELETCLQTATEPAGLAP